MSPVPSRWKWLADLVAIDLRALAALRIGVAVILLVDLAYRARDLAAFYTDEGILPRSARMDLAIRYSESWWMSLHMLGGSFGWAAFLAILAAAAAVMLLVGWKTKFALAASWLLLYSIQARFPMLLQGGDVLLRCTLVWMFFLPIDARWSLSRKANAVDRATSVTCFGAAGLYIQLGSMYFFSALLKTSPMWIGDFSATYYALHIDHFTRPLGYLLAELTALLKILTAITIVLELVGPLLFLAPLGRRFWRWLIPLAFSGFHFGLYLSMDLGTFPWICILCWAVFLPTEFWNAVDGGANGIRGAEKLPSLTLVGHESRFYGGFAANTLAATLLIYILALNTAKLRHPYSEVGNFPINQIGRLTGLEQYWNMFAPGPYPYGSWVRVEGVLPNGELVNLYEPSAPLADEKPSNVSASYPTQYWRRCFVMAYEVKEKPHLDGLLRYLTRCWNESHAASEQIREARFVHMTTPTPPPDQRRGESVAKAERKVLYELRFTSSTIAAK